VDFRSAGECERSPSIIIPGTICHNIDLVTSFPIDGPGNLEALEGVPVSTVWYFMEEFYEMLVREKSALTGYRRFIDLLLALEDGAILFHCFAGKDRTGVASAIILTLLGVSQEDIIRDYMRSNRARSAENRTMLAEAKENGFNEQELRVLQAQLSVRSQYLKRAISTAEKNYGSLYNMARNGLNVTDIELDRLCKKYLEN